MKLNKALLNIKLKATGIHLSLSLVIFFILAYLVFYVWFPLPYFLVDGGWQGIRIIAAVDLVLGPLITFLIFDSSKSRREISFDLSVIVIIQTVALIYGVMTTYNQRPVAIVLVEDFVVSAIASDYGDQLESLDDLSRYSSETPPVIYAEIPINRESIDEINRIKSEQNIKEHAQLALYQPFSSLAAGLGQRQGTFNKMLEVSGKAKVFEQWLEQYKQSKEAVLIALFSGRYGQMWLVFDDKGHYLGYF